MSEVMSASRYLEEQAAKGPIGSPLGKLPFVLYPAVAQVMEEYAADWKRLAMLRSNLLVCYRVGKQPSDKLLNEIAAIRDRLEE